ncbi:hypothetical protein K491DRAFT_696277 [Lophiostoma macrostomum CBS 122681]|uniref:Uncharacterized protein n=1 Tax=Lophiostoma macrostomum CBS 122681 TaxID=1314788 RepID=A0A6A6SX83_9PLEO|nr:hypothetical protein K491DRAFT_696277 [Lophiostoma macrostomum CBS 122681]
MLYMIHSPSGERVPAVKEASAHFTSPTVLRTLDRLQHMILHGHEFAMIYSTRSICQLTIECPEKSKDGAGPCKLYAQYTFGFMITLTLALVRQRKFLLPL